MRRWLALSFVSLFVVVGTASADVFVRVDYDKEKDVTVTETITITKDVLIDIDVDVVAQRAAESEALINQVNNYNEACENCAEKMDMITDSIDSNTGIVIVNQAAGNMNNQASSISVSLADAAGLAGLLAFANAQAAVEQINGQPLNDVNGTAEPQGSVQGPGNLVDAINILIKSAEIAGSITNNSGIVDVNQAAGNMANQGNALAVSVGFADGGVALSESDLGQVNRLNEIRESAAPGNPDFVGSQIRKDATITASVNNNSGMLGINQTSGNMANQANNFAIAVVKPQ